VSMIRTAEKSHMWLVSPFNENMKQQIQVVAGMGGAMIPKDMQPLVNALAGAKAVGAWASLDNNGLSYTASMMCGDAGAAKKAATGLQQTIKTAQRDVPKQVLAMDKDLISSINCTSDGNMLQVSGRVNSALVGLAAKEIQKGMRE